MNWTHSQQVSAHASCAQVQMFAGGSVCRVSRMNESGRDKTVPRPFGLTCGLTFLASVTEASPAVPMGVALAATMGA